EGERRFDEIAFKRRVQTGAVGLLEGTGPDSAAILMAQIELDGTVSEILTLERIIGRALVVEPGAELAPADGEGALGKQRPEARAAAPERAEGGVELIGQAARR